MDHGSTVGIFIRVPAREADQLRRHAAGLDVTTSRLVRMIVHRALAEAGAGQLTLTPGGKNGNGH